MRSFIFLTLLPLAFACDNPENDACASIMTASSADAASFCLTYTQAANTATTGLPGWAEYCGNKSKRVSSACSCLVANTLATVVATTAATEVRFLELVDFSVLMYDRSLLRLPLLPQL